MACVLEGSGWLAGSETADAPRQDDMSGAEVELLTRRREMRNTETPVSHRYELVKLFRRYRLGLYRVFISQHGDTV